MLSCGTLAGCGIVEEVKSEQAASPLHLSTKPSRKEAQHLRHFATTNTFIPSFSTQQLQTANPRPSNTITNTSAPPCLVLLEPRQKPACLLQPPPLTRMRRDLTSGNFALAPRWDPLPEGLELAWEIRDTLGRGGRPATVGFSSAVCCESCCVLLVGFFNLGCVLRERAREQIGCVFGCEDINCLCDWRMACVTESLSRDLFTHALEERRCDSPADAGKGARRIFLPTESRPARSTLTARVEYTR